MIYKPGVDLILNSLLRYMTNVTPLPDSLHYYFFYKSRIVTLVTIHFNQTTYSLFRTKQGIHESRDLHARIPYKEGSKL